MFHAIDPGKSGKTTGVNPWSVKCQKRLISQMKKIDKDSKKCSILFYEYIYHPKSWFLKGGQTIIYL